MAAIQRGWSPSRARGRGDENHRGLVLEDPVSRSREDENQKRDYSCRSSRGRISGRGFDSPRLHHHPASGRLSAAGLIRTLKGAPRRPLACVGNALRSRGVG